MDFAQKLAQNRNLQKIETARNGLASREMIACNRFQHEFITKKPLLSLDLKSPWHPHIRSPALHPHRQRHINNQAEPNKHFRNSVLRYKSGFLMASRLLSSVRRKHSRMVARLTPNPPMRTVRLKGYPVSRRLN